MKNIEWLAAATAVINKDESDIDIASMTLLFK